MCYSFESSYNNWLLSLITAAVLILSNRANDSINRTNIWTGLFTLTFAQVQIIEALIWNELNHANPDSDKLHQLTGYLPVLLMAQPLVQSIGAYYLSQDAAVIPLILFNLSMLLYQTYTVKRDRFNSVIGPNGHLIWQRFNASGESQSIFGDSVFAYLYVVSLLLPIFWIPNRIIRISLIVYGLASLFYSLYSVPEFGSYWCYIAIGYGITGLVTSYLVE